MLEHLGETKREQKKQTDHAELDETRLSSSSPLLSLLPKANSAHHPSQTLPQHATSHLSAESSHAPKTSEDRSSVRN